MNNLCVDAGYKSINKYGEQLCGDMVQLIKTDDTTIFVLADGLGSGVKANILSTLTSKIIATMVEAKMSIDECVTTIMDTLPVCSERGVAYATFTIIKITNNNIAEIIQYDNPDVILLRDGKNTDYKKEVRIIGGKTISESKIILQKDDVFVAMSDGVIYAGSGKTMNYGWQREEVVEYLEGNYSNNLSAQGIAAMLTDACNDLYDNKPGDDTTVAAIRIRERKAVNLLFGPSKEINDTNKMLGLFFAKQGIHIVSGGTTSAITARYLGKEIETDVEYVKSDIPPISRIDGVDLVTEGVITINRVLEYAKDLIKDNEMYNKWHIENDGASQIARLLFEKATDINFYVGRAINPAHQNPDLPIGINIKMQLIEELTAVLKKMGKVVNISYF